MILPHNIRSLPVTGVLDQLREALRNQPNAVLQAPPGAGKTTAVPLALLNEPWLPPQQKIIMLEPRRLAARAAARRMADLLDERVGETVGYRMRMDTCVGAQTRIEVVTEGVFTRLLHADPGLESVGLVIFDEFHERSLNADLGLTLALDMQAVLRPDMRLLIMSATIAAVKIAELVKNAAVISAEGRMFPVETHYAATRASTHLEQAVAATVVRALEDDQGSALVFLPGAGEIRRVHAALKAAGLPQNVHMAPLHGNLSKRAQDDAILPAPAGFRKVVLATDIAETSITIEGIRIVVDSGFRRVPRFDPRTGMTRLDTVRISRASADQRRGRAGRVEPGICYRMWTESEQAAMPAFEEPEIINADLSSLVLDLADWGVQNPDSLDWLDRPPEAATAQARDLLMSLGALTAEGRPTRHGQAMQQLGTHPRIAHMILQARELGQEPLACELAALIGTRDILTPVGGPGDPDVRLRLDALRTAGRRDNIAGMKINKDACRHVRQEARRLAISQSGQQALKTGDAEAAGVLLAFAYPDRLAQKRQGHRNDYLLSNGRGAFIRGNSHLLNDDYLVIADLDDAGRNARIWLAASIPYDSIFRHFADRIEHLAKIEWDTGTASVLSREEWLFGELLLRQAPLRNPAAEKVVAAMLQGIRENGIGCLPWNRDSRDLQARIMFLRRTCGESWPDLSDATLESALDTWLGPFIQGITRLDDLSRLDLMPPLFTFLDWNQQRRLDELAPTHLAVPSGSRVRLNYQAGEIPVLPVRLQEMFGARETPRVAGGRIAVLLHLLSPAGRPVQITQDLENFWNDTYDRVRKDLHGRYPRHHWPEDPWQATPTRRAKPRK